jgi:hypothetical protein
MPKKWKVILPNIAEYYAVIDEKAGRMLTKGVNELPNIVTLQRKLLTLV